MKRLDVLMVARGLASSRTKAQRYIVQGKVSVNHHVVRKASTMVDDDALIDIADTERYVSRGAYKLAGALSLFAHDGLPPVAGLQCLDIGASTGGFCDVLLRQGAAQVIALDVGHDQLDPRIANDPRIIEMSGCNIRDITPEDLPFAPQCIVSDVSFISLTYVLPVIARIAAPLASVVVLIKPQFEVGRQGLGKHGVVTDPQLREQAITRVVQCAQTCGMRVHATAVSPIEGMHGNMEYLMYATCAA